MFYLTKYQSKSDVLFFWHIKSNGDFLLLYKKVIIQYSWNLMWFLTTNHSQWCLENTQFLKEILFFSIHLHCKDWQEKSSFWMKYLGKITWISKSLQTLKSNQFIYTKNCHNYEYLNMKLIGVSFLQVLNNLGACCEHFNWNSDTK